MISYSQNYEDVRLHRCFASLSTGFYIDVGASEPTRHNNTYAFYTKGWRGVSIEPLPDRFREHEMLRPRDTAINCALAETEGQATLFRSSGRGGNSTIDHKSGEAMQARTAEKISITVRTSTIAHIQNKFIQDDDWYEFLSIDVEGAEQSVLLGSDFSMIRPKVIIIEDSGNQSEIDNILCNQNYKFILNDRINLWYIHESCAKLGSDISRPIDYFDDVIRADKVPSPLHNSGDPDHRWALQLAAKMLSSPVVLDTEKILEALTWKYPAYSHCRTINQAECRQAFKDVLGRSPHPDELTGITNNEASKSIIETYRELLNGEEFAVKRGKLIARL